jgi:hypothetical protein
MIVKERDATKTRIAQLEAYESPDMDNIQRQGLKQAAARLRADSTSETACEYIDSYFSESSEWLIIHDLRMRYETHVMQINHLLISSSLDFYIVDSRYIKHGLNIDNNGRCWAVTHEQTKPIASPLNKLNRDIRILRDIIKSTKNLPSFIGISQPFSVQGYVLTNPTIRSQRPASDLLDTSAIIASDTLFSYVWEKRQSWLRSKLRHVESTKLCNFTQTLLSQHIPSVSNRLVGTRLSQLELLSNEEEDTSHCAQCSQPVTAYIREQSFRRMDICRGHVLCIDCQNKVQNQTTQTIF